MAKRRRRDVSANASAPAMQMRIGFIVTPRMRRSGTSAAAEKGTSVFPAGQLYDERTPIFRAKECGRMSGTRCRLTAPCSSSAFFQKGRRSGWGRDIGML
jgi:hypothetical protein